jgi:hypothetical protein
MAERESAIEEEEKKTVMNLIVVQTERKRVTIATTIFMYLIM